MTHAKQFMNINMMTEGQKMINISSEKTNMLIKNHITNKSESHIPVNDEIQRDALTSAKRQVLLKMAVEAFMNPVKIDMEDVMTNKWLLWKYRDQIQAERKRQSKWLDEAQDAPCGFAIGRRIFEKAEILVSYLSY